MRPFSLLFPLTVPSLLASLAPAQSSYAGPGFAQALEPAPGAPILALEVAQLDADPRPDLFYLLDDGRLLAERNVADQGRQETAATGVDALAVVRTAAGDRVLLSAGGALHELAFGDGAFTTTPLAGSAGWGGRFLRAVRTGAGAVPGVLTIANGGAALRCVDLVGGSWQLARTIAPAAPETNLIEADVLEWAGVEVVAALGSLGLTLHELATGAPLALDPTAPVPTFPCDPAGAHIAVLAAERNALAQDLLCWQRLIAGAPPTHAMGLLVFNATHMELLASDLLDLRQIAFADFLADDGGLAELVLSDPTAHTVYFARQVAPVPGHGIFQLEQDPSWTIDLMEIDPTVPPSQWADLPCVIAPGDHDLDGDGLNDLALTTPEDSLCILPGESANLTSLERPSVGYPSEPELLGAGATRRLRFTGVSTAPAWATATEVTVWHRPSDAGLVASTPLAPVAGGGAPWPQIDVQVEAPHEILLPGHYETFFLQLRFLDANGEAGPTTTLVWTPDPVGASVVWTEQVGSYAWIGGTIIGGGTVGGPRVRPIGDAAGSGG